MADLKGNTAPALQLKGSLSKGKKGTPQELSFTAKGQGRYEAALPKTETSLGTHQYALYPIGLCRAACMLPS